MRVQLQDSPPEDTGQETISPTTAITMAACPQSPKYLANEFKTCCEEQMQKRKQFWFEQMFDAQAETMEDGDSREEKLKKHREGNFHIIN